MPLATWYAWWATKQQGNPVSIKKDKIIIVDIEATCWQNNQIPFGQQNEIIEVGVCLLDAKSGELSNKRSILVKPEKSEVSPFCTELTTLTPEQVSQGVSFQEACAILEKEYDSRNRLWGSWGAYDHKMFRQQCKEWDIRYPFSKKHINIKRIFADQNNGRRVGMTWALNIADMELQGTHHRGHDDAWNIGRLLRYLLQRHGERILKRYW